MPVFGLKGPGSEPSVGTTPSGLRTSAPVLLGRPSSGPSTVMALAMRRGRAVDVALLSRDSGVPVPAGDRSPLCLRANHVDLRDSGGQRGTGWEEGRAALNATTAGETFGTCDIWNGEMWCRDTERNLGQNPQIVHNKHGP